MAPGKKSEIWRYFSPIDANHAKCNICEKTYSRTGRATSALRTHLKTIHSEEYGLIIEAEAEFKVSKLTNLPGTPLTEVKKQLSIEECLMKKKQWDNKHPQSQKIDYRISEMIALQNLPFNFVEGVGFRRLMQEVAPQYVTKRRNFHTEHVCRDLYEKVASKIKSLLAGVQHYSFTTDVWSEPSANVSLLSLTCHGITADFTRLTVILKCEEFDSRHTGDIIADKLKSMLTEWCITTEQVHCMVRDEGSNMKRAMILAGFQDIDCTIHKLQTNIKCALNSQQFLVDMIQKCNKVASHFNHSTIAQSELSKIQERLNPDLAPLTIMRDCTTRWNSTFYMFERFLKLKDSLCLYANSHNIPHISAEEWMAMESCVSILQPFEEATRNLSSSQALISSIIPIMYTLKKTIDDTTAPTTGNDTNDGIILNFIDVLKQEMTKKFSNLEDNSLFTISTFLDPRYKNKFFNDTVKERVNSDIVALVVNLTNQQHDNRRPSNSKKPRDNNINEPSTSAGCSGKSLISNLAGILDSSSEDEGSGLDLREDRDTQEQEIKAQIKSYLKEKRAPIDECPMVWWKNKFKYDKLTVLARKYLSAPPASVPSEQLFSAAGLIYEPLRNRLIGEKAAKLLFIKYNLLLLKFDY